MADLLYAYSPVSPVAVRSRKPRTLVLCFDGTTNEFGQHNTNVIKLYSILKKDRAEDQLCYYQAGIGTYFQPGVVSPFFRFVARILDEAIAWYLAVHVMDGYRFLMQNYTHGDKVCLFGFSRGAYTARALAGMLHKVGLLSKDNPEQVPFAYKLYKSSRASDNLLAEGFKRSFCREVPIEFLGVWDTVASVGLLKARTLPFVGTNTTIKTFRQALSLDERRAKFRPNLYHRPMASPPPMPTPGLGRASTLLSRFRRHARRRYKQIIDTPRAFIHSTDPNSETDLGSHMGFKTNVKEVWFAGSHSDVGGGLASDSDPHALANIPLRWMVREIMQAQCGILFDGAALRHWHIPITFEQAFLGHPPPGQATLHKFGVTARKVSASAPGPPQLHALPGVGLEARVEAEADGSQDALDVVQRAGDAMWKNPAWWLLELLPTHHAWQDQSDEWIGGWSFNLGRGRQVPPQPLFHKSVEVRMKDPKLGYVPRARYLKGTEKYVV